MAIELINCIKFRGKYEQVKYMADMGCDVNYFDDNLWTALHWCITYNEARFEDRCRKIICFLVNCGAIINAKDFQGRTPLMVYIIENCRNALILSLLDYGASVTCKDMHFQTALHVFSKYRYMNFRLLRLLMSKTEDINMRDINGLTPLMHFLIEGSKEEYIEMLLLSNSDVTKRTNLDNTVLHFYADWKCKVAFRTTGLKILTALYGNGTLLNIRNSDGRSALMLFILNKLPANDVRYILYNGANVNDRDRKGETALHLIFENLCDSNPYTEVLQMLLEYGADPNAVNIYGKTTLPSALLHGTEAHIMLLYNYGLNRVHGRNIIRTCIRQGSELIRTYQVVIKYMLLDDETIFDDFIVPNNLLNAEVKAYLEGLIGELRRMRSRILVHPEITMYDFTIETDRQKNSSVLRNCSINLKIVNTKFPEYADIIESKIQLSNLYT